MLVDHLGRRLRGPRRLQRRLDRGRIGTGDHAADQHHPVVDDPQVQEPPLLGLGRELLPLRVEVRTQLGADVAEGVGVHPPCLLGEIGVRLRPHGRAVRVDPAQQALREQAERPYPDIDVLARDLPGGEHLPQRRRVHLAVGEQVLLLAGRGGRSRVERAGRAHVPGRLRPGPVQGHGQEGVRHEAGPGAGDRGRAAVQLPHQTEEGGLPDAQRGDHRPDRVPALRVGQRPPGPGHRNRQRLGRCHEVRQRSQHRRRRGAVITTLAAGHPAGPRARVGRAVIRRRCLLPVHENHSRDRVRQFRPRGTRCSRTSFENLCPQVPSRSGPVDDRRELSAPGASRPTRAR